MARALIALLAFAGGAIHFAVLRHHLEYEAITIGFAVIGAAQWLVAARFATGSSARVRSAGLLLHAAILSTWLLSRTTGLAVVPGAEDRLPVGIPDLVANLFAVGFIAATVVLPHASGRRRTSARRHARCAAAAVGVVALTVPAVLAGHRHAGHDHPPARAGDDQDHDHEHG